MFKITSAVKLIYIEIIKRKKLKQNKTHLKLN